MTVAFKAQVTSTQKLVLLALCDCANDQGECYPSVTLLEEKCSLSDRAVQKAISELEQAGYLSREIRSGRSTLFTMTPERGSPRTTFTPNDVHHTPERRSPPPPNVVHPTPERGSPRTINESSIEPSKKRQSAAPVAVDASELVKAGFTESVAAEFIEHKRRLKAPLTPRAWADHQREAAKAGWSVVDAAEKVMAKNWRGFEAKYVADERSRAPPGMTAREQRQAENVRAWMGSAYQPDTEEAHAAPLALR